MVRQGIDKGNGGQAITPSKRRLLLVDEDLDDLFHYSAVLQNQGYEVCSIPSYTDGSDRLAREDFDLAIVSQGSPNFEGRSVLTRAIEGDRFTPVLVLTRSIEIPCYLEAMQLGALDYLEKPRPVSEIGKLVARHLKARPRAGQARWHAARA